MTSRREFLVRAGAGAVFVPALSRVFAGCKFDDLHPDNGYGPLVVAGPELSLPAGFRYVLFGAAGTLMDDGIVTPGAHDGMAVFLQADGTYLLYRNHELGGTDGAIRALGAYDAKAVGGVTVTVWDPATEQVVESHLGVSGTIENCNGGGTPRGTWLTCEECTEGTHDGYDLPHGYVFEVTADPDQTAVPLTGLGRFVHEAAATDPVTGIVYMTEDNGDPGDGVYRFVPTAPDDLLVGGTLQMLAITGAPSYDTATGQTVGAVLPVEWVTIADPDPVDADKHPEAVYAQGRALGGARFLAPEGASFDANEGVFYFAASEGGDAERGQVWCLRPMGDTGELTLIYESSGKTVLDSPDGVTVSPNGCVVLCEDGDGDEIDGGDNYIRCVTPGGKLFDFAKNLVSIDLNLLDDEDFPTPGIAFGASEFAGACFSPDGKWLFVNIQFPGVTVAITGPWEDGPL
jgi:secreted PhoX family phosphatase